MAQANIPQGLAVLRLLLAVAVLLVLSGCALMPSAPAGLAPPAPREFRALWVATVANIDWPGKPGLPVAAQREEMQRILATGRWLKLNALILQVRPAADAIYPSALEPWSEYLSGVQGVAPGDGYDPLAEWVTAAHASGMELHAWFNPYRARHASAKSPLAVNHIANAHPHVVKAYGDVLWMDPGEALASARTLAVIADVVRRYDIDGVHMDDYFYPYPVKATGDGNSDELAFPDGPSWARYRAQAGPFAWRDRADWRRSNVDRLVRDLYRTVHAIKPWVKVGISPFGIGRPDRRPPGIVGFSQYDKLYADVERWLRAGWLDYLAPQLYWPIDRAAQSFPLLLDYWAGENWRQRHLWPGLFTSRIDDSEKSWQPEEIPRQIALQRDSRGATGHIHFSAAAMVQDRKGIAVLLTKTTYAQAALVPPTPWLRPADWQRLPAPRAGLVCSPAITAGERVRTCRVVVQQAASDALAATGVLALWWRHGDAWHFEVANADAGSESVPVNRDGKALNLVVARLLDRYGMASDEAVLPVTDAGPDGSTR